MSYKPGAALKAAFTKGKDKSNAAEEAAEMAKPGNKLKRTAKKMGTKRGGY
tara:strand:- start:394 stop:546 length:153 start_codon:yes stop_codon:yes gene_type:complete